MREKLIQRIALFESFKGDNKYPIKKVKQIIDTIWVLRDCDIINERDFSIVYDRAIQAIATLECSAYF